MTQNAYYQDEIHYLREVGPEFARAHPEVARFLADRGSDPDVERILEGVAFLCGRIREKLDDELPELTANVMALLWPHYLRPIPSMSILEFLPEIEAMQGPLTVEAGSESLSVPIDGTRCRYRTCWPTVLRPWVLRELRLETASALPVRLVMLLQASPKAKLQKLDLASVRFHLAGDPRTAFLLYLLLGAHVERVTVGDGTARHDRGQVVLGPEHVVPAGLSHREGVLPYPDHSFAGYRLLQEYFAFKERFLFVDVRGLDRAVDQLGLNDTVEVAVTFNRRCDSFPVIARDNVRLHCVPIINLFQQPADPIRIRHDRREYLIQPARTGAADRRHLEIFSVDQVTGMVRGDSQPREYAPFYSFRHGAGADHRTAAYYQTHVRPNILGGDPRLGTDTYLSLVPGSSLRDYPEEESISIELVCTNRNLPEAIRAGDIVEPTDSSPPNARFRNILKPTPTICPPLGKGLHWRLISHLSLNYVSLADVDRFKELLRVYDFQAEHDAQRALAHQRMMDGIVSVHAGFDERIVRGAPLRGSQIEIRLHEDHFAGEGDAYLFARILDRFMGLYATVNAYTQLTARLIRSGQVHTFPARWGEQLTPADSREGGDRG